MSHVALQRVMVRMLYDPEFTTRVLGDPLRALAGVALTADERGWLLRPDRRAWSVDPERPARSLGSLLQRYATSAALALRSTQGQGIEPLRRFFRSAHFHRCIQERGSMAMAFGDHLADLVESGESEDRRVLPLARLEQAIAALHRTSPSKPPSRDANAAAYRLSPDVALHRATRGTAELQETIYRSLRDAGGGLVEVIVDDARSLPAGGIDFAHDEPLLLELARGGGPRVTHSVTTTEVPDELFSLLAFAAHGQRREALESEVVRLGAGADDATAVIAGLIADGTLVPHLQDRRASVAEE